MSLSVKEIQKLNDKKVSEFLAKTIHSLAYFFGHNIMDSFDVKFEYNKKQYNLTLIESVKESGENPGTQFNLILGEYYN